MARHLTDWMSHGRSVAGEAHRPQARLGCPAERRGGRRAGPKHVAEARHASRRTRPVRHPRTIGSLLPCHCIRRSVVPDDVNVLAQEYFDYLLVVWPTWGHMMGNYDHADRYDDASRAGGGPTGGKPTPPRPVRRTGAEPVRTTRSAAVSRSPNVPTRSRPTVSPP